MCVVYSSTFLNLFLTFFIFYFFYLFFYFFIFYFLLLFYFVFLSQDTRLEVQPHRRRIRLRSCDSSVSLLKERGGDRGEWLTAKISLVSDDAYLIFSQLRSKNNYTFGFHHFGLRICRHILFVQSVLKLLYPKKEEWEFKKMYEKIRMIPPVSSV